VSLSVGALVKKLNTTCVDSLQGAAALCLARTNPTVEIEHWLAKLIEVPGCDLARLIAHFQIDAEHLRGHLAASLDRLRTGHERTPTLSLSIERLLKESWLIASVQFQASSVRSGHLLLALLSDEELGLKARALSREWTKIKVEKIFDPLPGLIAGSIEDEPTAVGAGPGGGRAYLVDLSAKARAEPDNPMVLGREPEVRRLVEILNCRLKNVPVLLGEPGVGCEAVVEALAWAVATGRAPVGLEGHAVWTLEARGLIAEDDPSRQLADVLKAFERSGQPVVLHIDGLGLVAGAGDGARAARLAGALKAALGRGQLRCIGSTTDAEFRRIIRADPAFNRWLQPVPVKELSVEATVRVLRGLKASLEQHHKVAISDPALVAAAGLSARYVTGSFLPEKAIELVDEVASSRKFDSHAAAGEVESVDAADVVKAVAERTGLSVEEIGGAEAEPAGPDLRPDGSPESPERTRRTRVFISHSAQDREFVEGEIIGFLHEHGIDPWYSRDDIRPTDTWERTILRGLKSCEWFLLVMSPRSAQSEWVKDEVNWAVVERPGRIIPVLIEDCQTSDFHIRLPRIQHVDLREVTPQARRLLLALLDEPAG
jgi:type VI secretion system protein VasG